MARDEAEAHIEAVRIGPALVGGELHDLAAAPAALLDGDDAAIRVAVTVPKSEELERVVRIPAKLAEQAGDAQERMRRVLDEAGILQDRELTVAVLAQMVRQLLTEGDSGQKQGG